MRTDDIQAFEALTGFRPFLWQQRLFDRFLGNDLPSVCDIPTGLGKTSVMAIWLLAIARQAQTGSVRLPRRLVYVVDRRTIVDQATDDAEALRRALRKPDASAAVHDVKTSLAALCVDPDDDASPLAISTLRGELADNREWQADPARPAVIVGTVDLIGSRLLFSGYRAGWKSRAFDAGLIGEDSLVVLDEAHLSPSFGTLLSAIVKAQHAEPRPLRVMELSATQRAPDRSGSVFRLQADEWTEPLVRRRVEAAKALRVKSVASPAELIPQLARGALRHRDSQARVLVFVRSPDDAKAIRDVLASEVSADRVELLTGTLRGYERDRLVKGDVYLKLKAGPSRERVECTVFLVSTSAGEVGANLDADHLVCDLTTLDSMIQRLGRVNRFGRDDPSFVAEIDVIDAPSRTKRTQSRDVREGSAGRAEPSPYDAARSATRAALLGLPAVGGPARDASPAALRGTLDSDAIQSAFAPTPRVVPCSDVLLDAWSLTSVRDSLPGRPAVDPWLHGVQTEPPETTFVWRAETPALAILAGRTGTTQEVEQWLDAHRIEARERLRIPMPRAKDHIERMVKRLSASEREQTAIVVRDDGSIRTRAIGALADESTLSRATVLLPPEVGGLESGMLDSRAANPVADVADASGGDSPARLRVQATKTAEGRWEVRVLGSLPDGLRNRLVDVALDSDASLPDLSATILDRLNGGATTENRLVEQRALVLDEDDGGGIDVLLSFAPAIRFETAVETSAAAPQQQTVDEHNDFAGHVAERLAARLSLPADLGSAVVRAARGHDSGKNRDPWQRAILHGPPADPVERRQWVPLAKTRHGRFLYRMCPGYRHEFGSLLEAGRDAALGGFAERELVLHLIAAHHARARPHFPGEAWDPEASDEENAEAALQAIRRFARLQRRFGRWGLAWLEAMVKSADVIATVRGQAVKGLRA